MVTRTYDVKSVALAVDAPLKWVDNLLSHHAVAGVSGGRQGLQRQVTFDGLLIVHATRMLTLALRIPVHRAVALAQEAFRARSPDDTHVSAGAAEIEITLPVALMEARLRERLVEAAESIAVVPRGRPRRSVRDTS